MPHEPHSSLLLWQWPCFESHQQLLIYTSQKEAFSFCWYYPPNSPPWLLALSFSCQNEAAGNEEFDRVKCTVATCKGVTWPSLSRNLDHPMSLSQLSNLCLQVQILLCLEYNKDWQTLNLDSKTSQGTFLQLGMHLSTSFLNFALPVLLLNWKWCINKQKNNQRERV